VSTLGNADATHPVGLLRARRKRPRCHTTEERDEVAPFQLSELHALPLGSRGQHGGLVQIKSGPLLEARAAGDREGQARLAAFLQGLQELGWTDGRNVRIDYRWAAADADRSRTYAAELVALALGFVIGRILCDVRSGSGLTDVSIDEGEVRRGGKACLGNAARSCDHVIAATEKGLDHGFSDAMGGASYDDCLVACHTYHSAVSGKAINGSSSESVYHRGPRLRLLSL
jgi:hypothetical protein